MNIPPFIPGHGDEHHEPGYIVVVHIAVAAALTLLLAWLL